MRQRFILKENVSKKTILRTRHIEKVYAVLREKGFGAQIPEIGKALAGEDSKSLLLINHAAYLELRRKPAA